MAAVIENQFPEPEESDPVPVSAGETGPWADFDCRCAPEPEPTPPQADPKPQRKPTDLERVCLMLENALGMTAEVADLSDQLRLRLYGQQGDRQVPGEIPRGLAVLPRLMALASLLRDQTERTEANLADVSQMA